MKILWLTNVPSPYRVDFFNELGKSCDLTVVFEKRTSDERDKSWMNYLFDSFKGVFLEGKSMNTDTAFCPSVIKYVKEKKYDHIVVTNISSPTGIIAIAYMRMNNIPYWIEGDGGFPKKGNAIKTILKRFTISHAKGCFSTGKSHDEYYLSYGANCDKIYRYPFTSLMKTDIIDAALLADEDKRLLRKELNMFEDRIVLSVGRFSYKSGYGKGYDILMHCAERLGKNYGFYIVGDEPTEEFLRWKDESNLTNVHFVGYQEKTELARYYGAADCFALLSRGEAWELVINEAMAYGLPIVSTEACVAGTELVKNGVNGFLVAPEDIAMTVEALNTVLDPEKKRIFSRNSFETIQNYTIENMARVHINYLEGGVRRNSIRLLSKSRLGISREKKVVLYVGQMIYRKGIELLLESAADLCIENRDLLFIFVGGEITDYCREEYMRVPKDRIRVVPYLTKDKLKDYFRAADYLCLPTREDIWGLVINEGMSFQLPIITTTACGAGIELVKNGENGILIEPNDASQISCGITSLMQCNDICQYEYSSLKNIWGYTIENMVDEHIRIFNKNNNHFKAMEKS